MTDQFKKNINRAIEIIVHNFMPTIIYLFGSASKNTLRKDSDIDIAFLSDSVVGDYDLFQVAQSLYDIFKRDVDLIDLSKASTVFKTQVIAYGEAVYNLDDNKRMQFEMEAFKEYALLNEERYEILNSIKERGKVYE